MNSSGNIGPKVNKEISTIPVYSFLYLTGNNNIRGGKNFAIIKILMGRNIKVVRFDLLG